MIKVLDGPLFQWDTGRRVIVSGDTDFKMSEVHFALDSDSKTFVVNCYEEDGIVYANIPNSILQNCGICKVFSVFISPDGKRTTESIDIYITKRPKPDDYVYTDDELKSFEELEKKISDLYGEIEQIKQSG